MRKKTDYCDANKLPEVLLSSQPTAPPSWETQREGFCLLAFLGTQVSQLWEHASGKGRGQD